MATLIGGPAHGGQTRGQTAGAMPGMGVGRFGQMFEDSSLDRPWHADSVLLELAELMTGGGLPPIDDGKPIRDIPGPPLIEASDAADENPVVPAGYTYFGQFVDHDMTFDPTPLHGKTVDVGALEDFRTPALDLDSVYGSGPDNQPYLYKSGADGFAHLRTGDDLDMATFQGVVTRRDHFRLPPDDSTKPEVGRPAILGDKRNDENKIVAQVHTAFIALHNRLMDDLPVLQKLGGTDLGDPNNRFRTAVKAARWHYQWVVLFDYVRDRICEPGMLDEVLNLGGSPRLGNYAANKPQYAYIPVEFAVAAYRMGHSMVRPSYALNAIVGSTLEFEKKRIPIFKLGAKPKEALNGFGQAIPAFWGIDWSFFLDGLAKPAAEPGKTPLAIPQPSYRMDATLVDPLRNLPEFEGAAAQNRNLAFRNLLRSRMDSLPSGEAVAHKLGITPIPFADVWWAGSAPHDKPADEDIEDLADRRKTFGRKWRSAIEGRTPLWYYILREAEIHGVHRTPGKPDPFGGQHLGPVGSRIVAETFVGLLWWDPNSFLHSQTGFKPVLPHAGAHFTLSDLIKYALG
jgi:hypothetical protein